ncbi:ArsR/SmtB family transcription factor [Corynebacterium lubricantis]|uniref:ArsR/SmtB family transcription factor n=1 Tax=Corynebacterium lubricantis TaxID=541095 RepID=UPI0003740B55|nr:metalloregulator ArsR/SmtB family transcription factor [Corynebacterium lubricantis]
MTDLDRNLAIAEGWSPTFKIMGDPTRLKLLSAIHFAGQHKLTVSELAEATGLRVATTSAALRSMETARIVSCARDGRTMRYGIADDRVHRLLHEIGAGHSY